MASNVVSNLATLLLQKQLKELTRNPVAGFSAGLIDDTDVFRWRIVVEGPQGTLYEGGYFNLVMTFPENYPDSPPTARFTSKMWHPNVFPDGVVCISILHPPGEDPDGYELASERWSPAQSVETIMVSLLSMLSSPNDESPANVEAAKQWREDRAAFKKKVRAIVRLSEEAMWEDAI